MLLFFVERKELIGDVELLGVFEEELSKEGTKSEYLPDYALHDAVFVVVRRQIGDSVAVFTPENHLPEALQLLQQRVLLQIVDNSDEDQSGALDHAGRVGSLAGSWLSTPPTALLNPTNSCESRDRRRDTSRRFCIRAGRSSPSVRGYTESPRLRAAGC